MRSFAISALMALSLGLAATSGAFAAPINATSIGKSASEIAPVTTAHYTGYYHRHRYYPNSYHSRYAPYYDRHFYYGYGVYRLCNWSFSNDPDCDGYLPLFRNDRRR